MFVWIAQKHDLTLQAETDHGPVVRIQVGQTEARFDCSTSTTLPLRKGSLVSRHLASRTLVLRLLLISTSYYMLPKLLFYHRTGWGC